MYKSSLFSNVENEDKTASKSGLVKMAALGRKFRVGMLYDFCSDSIFTPAVNVPRLSVQSTQEDDQGSTCDDDRSVGTMASSMAKDFFDQRKTGLTSFYPLQIRTHVQKDSEIELNVEKLSFDQGPSSKFHHMKLDAHLQASVMAGLVEGSSGSSLYLNDETDTSQAARVLLFRLIFGVWHDGMLLGDKEPEVTTGKATHIVSAVEYGAEAYVVFQRYLSENEVKEDVELDMDEDLEKLIEALLDDTEPDIPLREKPFLGTFYGDLHVRPRNRRSFSDVFKLVRNLKTNIEMNPDLAVPLTVWLRPLGQVDLTSELIRPLNEDVLSGCRRILDGIAQIKAKATLLTVQEENKKFSIQRKSLFHFIKCIETYVVLFRSELKELIPAVRSGQKESYSIRNLMDLVEGGFFHPLSLSRWLNNKENELETLRLISRLTGQGHLSLVATKEKLDSILDDIKWKWIVALVLPSLDDRIDPTLKAMEEYFDTNPRIVRIHRDALMETGSGEETPCSAAESIRQDLREMTRRMSLQAGRKRDDRVLYIMTPVLNGPSPYRPLITLYEEGGLIKKDFHLPVPPVNVRLNSISPVNTFYVVEWDYDHPEDVVFFVLEYKGIDDADWTSINTPCPAKSIQLGSVRNASGYEFRVAAVSVIGTGDFSPVFKVQSVPEVGPSPAELQLQVSELNLKIATIQEQLQNGERLVLQEDVLNKLQDCRDKIMEMKRAHDNDIDRLSNQFNGTEEKVTQLPSVVENLGTEVTNLKEYFQAFSATNKAAVLVFGASHGVKMAEGDCITYRDLDVSGSSEHGEFDKDTGVFEVKTAGKYQFHFNGISNKNPSTRVFLEVNEENRAECSYHNMSVSSFLPLCVNCPLTLDSGDVVSVVLNRGSLYESGDGCTKFSALFLSAA